MTSTLTRPEVLAALRTLRENGLSFADCIRSFAAADIDPDSEVRRAWAKVHLASSGEIEVDDSAIVSAGGDSGAYVMAWLWVADREVWTGPIDSDGDLCRFLNRYECDDCGTQWEDQASCSGADNKCPDCGIEFVPFQSIELDLAGNPLPDQEGVYVVEMVRTHSDLATVLLSAANPTEAAQAARSRADQQQLWMPGKVEIATGVRPTTPRATDQRKERHDAG